MNATIPPTSCEGVLIAQGGKFGGWTLFVKDNYLHYEHNFVGMAHYRIVADVPLPKKLGAIAAMQENDCLSQIAYA